MEPLLDVRGVTLQVHRGTPQSFRPVRDVSFQVGAGEFVAIVGESGSGKTLVTRLVLGLLPGGVHRENGNVRFLGRDTTELSQAERRRINGRSIGAVFQDPVSALNPVMTVGQHLAEARAAHRDDEAGQRLPLVELLARVGIKDPERRMRQYPHELSGGLCQRVMIAVALANEPALLVADEPTTALDATVQKRVLNLLRDIRREMGTAVLMVSHDLSVVRSVADRVVVMERGTVVETGRTAEVLSNPQHPYTAMLLRNSPTLYGELVHAEPRGGNPSAPRAVTTDEMPIVVEAAGLVKRYRVRSGMRGRETVTALDDVHLRIREGEAVGLVGESGSGKSTLAKTILGLEQPTSGTVSVLGVDVYRHRDRRSRQLRRSVQTVFQNPHRSLDPRMTALQSMIEPLRLRPLAASERVDEIERLMELVGFDPGRLDSYPHQLSGGQCQRLAIARALASEPQVLLLDEPTSALDVTIQAQIIELLRDLQGRLRVAYLFITHDLAVVRQVVDSLHVMHSGRIVESGSCDQLLRSPRDEYTRELISAAPDFSGFDE